MLSCRLFCAMSLSFLLLSLGCSSAFEEPVDAEVSDTVSQEIRYEARKCDHTTCYNTGWLDRDNPSGAGDYESEVSHGSSGCPSWSKFIYTDWRVKGTTSPQYTERNCWSDFDNYGNYELWLRNGFCGQKGITPDLDSKGTFVCRNDLSRSIRCQDYEVRYICLECVNNSDCPTGAGCGYKGRCAYF